MAEEKQTVQVWTTPEELLQDALRRPPGQEVALSIRAFIALWGAQRRGYTYVEDIRSDLEQAGLTTDPSFEVGWIDNTIVLKRLENLVLRSKPGSGDPDTVNSDPSALGQALRVSSLAPPSMPLVWVRPEIELAHVESLMVRYDFSQIPVLRNDREPAGVVSWDSIGQARMHSAECTTREAMVEITVIRADDNLLQHVPLIVRDGFALVRDEKRLIVRLVTTTDLSSAFLQLTSPFLMIGEIERRLRRVISDNFSIEEIADTRDPGDKGRVVKSADDLSFGEYVRLLQSAENYARLNWRYDRKLFLESLDKLRSVRNEVMHFSPDPLGQEDTDEIENLLRWMTRVQP